MKIKPHKWTKHHTHRVLHLSSFIAVFLVVMVCGWVFGTNLDKISANDITSNERVGLRIGEVSPGPTTGVGTTGGSGPEAQIGVPYITAAPASGPDNLYTSFTVNRDGQNQTEYGFTNPKPRFAGHTNIRNAEIYIEIRSADLIVTGNLRADFTGDWTWAPPVNIPLGEHILNFYAKDPVYGGINASGHLYFLVQAPGTDTTTPPVNPKPTTDKPPLVAQAPQIVINVLNTNKTLTAGGEVVAKINLNNISPAYKTKQATVTYTILEPSGKELLSSTDFVSLQQTSIAKSFYTNPDIESGSYILLVTVKVDNIVAMASDKFTVNSQEVVAAIQHRGQTNFTILLVMFTVFIFALLIMLYWEFNKVKLLTWRIRQLSHAK